MAVAPLAAAITVALMSTGDAGACPASPVRMSARHGTGPTPRANHDERRDPMATSDTARRPSTEVAPSTAGRDLGDGSLLRPLPLRASRRRPWHARHHPPAREAVARALGRCGFCQLLPGRRYRESPGLGPPRRAAAVAVASCADRRGGDIRREGDDTTFCPGVELANLGRYLEIFAEDAASRGSDGVTIARGPTADAVSAWSQAIGEAAGTL